MYKTWPDLIDHKFAIITKCAKQMNTNLDMLTFFMFYIIY